MERTGGHRRSLAMAALMASACGLHYGVPRDRARDARFGYLAGAPVTHEALCANWTSTMRSRDAHGLVHVSYPEADPRASCFVPVHYDDRAITVGATPLGCGYPDATQRARLNTLADALDAQRIHPRPIACSRPDRIEPDEERVAASTVLPCGLFPDQHDAALRHNAAALRATAASIGTHTYPYAAVITFGFGWPDQAETSIADWLPDDRCLHMTQRDLDRMGPMPLRARRVAEALRAGVAPFAIVSGGTEHSRMVEAFALMHLLRCGYGIPSERILVEPCAEHTHTNLRNSGRWLVAMGARTGYVVTDDGLQRDYLEEYGGFDVVGGSLDQRSLRDWHVLLGAWRRAAEGPNVGFWYSPYRFWAEPRDGAGSLTCVDTP